MGSGLQTDSGEAAGAWIGSGPQPSAISSRKASGWLTPCEPGGPGPEVAAGTAGAAGGREPADLAGGLVPEILRAEADSAGRVAPTTSAEGAPRTRGRRWAL